MKRGNSLGNNNHTILKKKNNSLKNLKQKDKEIE